ncbi:hypothetical protein NL676_038666 [Syzygium grande]|nr:hypothetical protein NL676_038666 [Syzygium grande]
MVPQLLSSLLPLARNYRLVETLLCRCPTSCCGSVFGCRCIIFCCPVWLSLLVIVVWSSSVAALLGGHCPVLRPTR